jgi:hypothetical protein
MKSKVMTVQTYKNNVLYTTDTFNIGYNIPTQVGTMYFGSLADGSYSTAGNEVFIGAS